MKKALRQLFFCKDSLINLNHATQQFPVGRSGSALRPQHYSLGPAHRLQSSGYDASALLGLIFSSGQFILKNI
jgi:hypothetical protein